MPCHGGSPTECQLGSPEWRTARMRKLSILSWRAAVQRLDRVLGTETAAKCRDRRARGRPDTLDTVQAAAYRSQAEHADGRFPLCSLAHWHTNKWDRRSRGER